MEIRVTVELGEKTLGILGKLFNMNQVLIEKTAEPIAPVTPTTTAAPVTPTVPTAAAVPTAPVPTGIPTAPVTQASIPTATAPVYTIASLTAAAGTLINNPVKLAELQALMQVYGVNALSEISQDKYPEIALALRGMGASI